MTNPEPKPILYRRSMMLLFLLLICIGIGALVLNATHTVHDLKQTGAAEHHNYLVSQMLVPRVVIDEKKRMVTSVAITRDGNYVLDGGWPLKATRQTQGYPVNILEHDAATGKLLRRFPGLFGQVEHVMLSPDGKRVCALGYTKPKNGRQKRVVAEWAYKTGKFKFWQPESQPCSYSPDSNRFASAHGVFNSNTGKQVCAFTDKVEPGCRPQFTRDGKYVLMIASQAIPNSSLPKPQSKTHTLVAHMAMASQDYFKAHSTMKLGIWDAKSGKPFGKFGFHYVTDFDVMPDGKSVIIVSGLEPASGQHAGGYNGSITRCVNIATGAVKWSYQRRTTVVDNDPNAYVLSVATTPNGKYVVLLGWQAIPVVLDAFTGLEVFRAQSPPSNSNYLDETGIAFSADGKTMVTRSGTRVLVWNASRLQ